MTLIDLEQLLSDLRKNGAQDTTEVIANDRPVTSGKIVLHPIRDNKTGRKISEIRRIILK